MSRAAWQASGLRAGQGRAPERGMLLLGVLVFLAVASLGLTLASQRWADAKRRDDEAQLLRVGQQYRAAIEAYYQRSPGPVKQLPGQIEDLLKDPRFPATVRHLREAYRDPLAPDRDWGLVRRGSGIVGVYSQADGEPFRQANLTPWLGYEVKAKSYEEWRFAFNVAAAASGASAAGQRNLLNPDPPGLPGGGLPGGPGNGAPLPGRPGPRGGLLR